MKAIIFFCTGLLMLNFTTLSNPDFTQTNTEDVLPRVFVIGEHESAYEQLVGEYETSLLTVCNSDMRNAFTKWLSMLEEMETYAKQIEYDMDGVKIWIHVFWNTDGSIQHLAYHLRPQSRNMDLQELSAFFSSFINSYRFPLMTDIKYAHYSSAQFPVFSKRLPVDNK